MAASKRKKNSFENWVAKPKPKILDFGHMDHLRKLFFLVYILLKMIVFSNYWGVQKLIYGGGSHHWPPPGSPSAPGG